MSGFTDDPNLSDSDPYQVTSRHEILGLLRRVLDNGLLIQMQGRLHTASIVTALLDIDRDQQRLVLDAAPQEAINRALLASDKVTFEVLVDQVKVQFSTDTLQAVQFDAKPALALPIPSSVRRIQRRGSYRIAVPVTDPATCTLPLTPTAVTLALHDISATGLALLGSSSEVDLPIGMVVKGCDLYLPDAGRLNIDLQIVRQQEQDLIGAKPVQRVGAAFIGLRGAEQTTVQNYIFGLERLMIARRRGLA